MELKIKNIRLDKITPREYQINIFTSIRNRNSLVVLPTGLGKTFIATMLVADKLEKGKVLFLAPTKPLCEQHHATLKELIEGKEIFLITGEKTKKEKRKEIYRVGNIIVATPQTIKNDIELLDFKKFSLVVFDEAHRAVGNYAYVDIGKKFIENNIQVLALTASPGSSIKRLREVIKNLGIENIEARTDDDPDVKPYVGERKIQWKIVEMPQRIKDIVTKIDKIINDFFVEMNKYIKISLSPKRVTKKMLLNLQDNLQKRISEGGSIYNAISTLAVILKLYHLKEMLTSQGVDSAKNYIRKIEKDFSRSGKKIRMNPEFIQIKREIIGEIENPKLEITKEIVETRLSENRNARIIIFAEYRDTIETIVSYLKKFGINSLKFIGQAKGEGDGMSQEEQKQVINKFRNGECNILVSTSIGEEGIDIPSTSLVIFYEPVASAIRHIQRRGRTARGGAPGEVVIIIMKGSRDEAYYWSSKRKEAKMMMQIKKMNDILKKKEKMEKREMVGQTKIDWFQ
ncbi:MAG: DEAD/DEAH box helicase family protein [Thermoplasmatales archaeon]|nr:DEAD/DEAH box helicase family protein [Thermoplasmatales archaeon]